MGWATRCPFWPNGRNLSGLAVPAWTPPLVAMERRCRPANNPILTQTRGVPTKQRRTVAREAHQDVWKQRRVGAREARAVGTAVMRIVGSSRPIVFRGAHTSPDDRTTSVLIDNARPQVNATSRFVSTRCAEGDTLLPSNEPAFGFARDTDRDLIGELRRAVDIAETLNTRTRRRVSTRRSPV